MTDLTPVRRVYAFLVLACAITWALDVPIAVAFLTGQSPPGYAMAMAGLSAFGPTIAALIVVGRGKRGSIARPFWAHPGWIVLALLTPMLLHLPATAAEVAMGGTPHQWLYPPSTPEAIAALVFFSIGEEFGWRGYAHPRMVALHGKVRGSLLLGLAWALWHALMMITPEGRFDVVTAVSLIVELPLYSILFAWFLTRTGGSVAVAIALHAGAHLDNPTHSPEDELRLRALRVLVLAIAAVIAARTMEPSPPKA